MEVTPQQFSDILNTSKEHKQISKNIYMIQVTNPISTYIYRWCNTTEDTVFAFLTIQPIRNRNILIMLDMIYAIASTFTYSTSGLPVKLFNQLLYNIHLHVVQKMQPKKETLDTVIYDYNQINHLIGEVNKQYKFPRIMQKQSIKDESQTETVVLQPSIVYGGVFALVTYINGYPSTLIDREIELFNLTGKSGSEQTVVINNQKMHIKVPTDQVFILQNKYYVQSPYQVLYQIQDSEQKQQIEYIFWNHVGQDVQFGRIIGTTRNTFLPNRIQINQRFLTLDKYYHEIKTIKPFIQEIADGYKSVNIDTPAYKVSDHMKHWKSVVQLLQFIYQIFFENGGLQD